MEEADKINSLEHETQRLNNVIIAARAEAREEYKSAVREYIRHIDTKDRYHNVQFYEGRMLGLEVALGFLGIYNDEIKEMYRASEEEVRVERERVIKTEKSGSQLIITEEL